MPVLHLGVLDIPYGGKRQVTTGDVAGWLESKYHVMEVFYEEHRSDVTSSLEKSVGGALESLVLGAPPALDPFGAGTSRVEDSFKQFLSLREMDRIGIPGIPTGAAQRGVSHRRKRPYAKRASRPSFIDTGLYQSSFKAWVS